MTLFGHSLGGRRAWPPGLCPGATVATVEHGVPLMRSKWVHRTWAHQGGTQGQGTRLADGPPICPATSRRTRHRQPRPRTGGPPGAPSTRKKTRRSRGPRRPARGQAHPREPTSTREEDEPASSGWKLPEDLGAKKMEAPRGAGTEKLSVPVRPPYNRWATADRKSVV